jgi:hypothetical protein
MWREVRAPPIPVAATHWKSCPPGSAHQITALHRLELGWILRQVGGLVLPVGGGREEVFKLSCLLMERSFLKRQIERGREEQQQV